IATPQWGGMELHAGPLAHVDVKQVAFSPMFSILPIYNGRLSADLQLGDATTGLTVIVDDLLMLGGLNLGAVPTPGPFFASPLEPYFETLSATVRLAGFGITFTLQRPFPRFSPLALFEAVGLIAAPSMPVDRDGPLGSSLRVAINGLSITLPPWAQWLF